MRLYLISLKDIRQKTYLLILAVIFLTGVLFYSNQLVPVSHSQPIYQGSGKDREVSIAVNVFWGEEHIPEMLEIFEQNKVKATFFLGGTWVEKFPKIAASIAKKGHEIGSHGWSHPHPDRLSKAGNLRDIKKAEEVIVKATGVKPKYYAPPYGERGPAVLQAADEADYTTILWSVDTIDWQLPSPGVLLQRVTDKVHNGAIILMHPTAPTVKALPEIIKQLKEKDYEIVTIPELMKGIDTGDSSVRSLNHTI